MDLFWKIGFEIELLAPKGLSRQDLAEAIADRHQGRVERMFHQQVEPSHVPGHPIFENLTLGYRALDSEGRWIAHCVDDLTLQDDLDKSHPPRPGWYRIVSDDARFLQLILCHCNPDHSIDRVLQDLARLFHTTLHRDASGMCRVCDASGQSVAIAAPLPGERERPCELVTAPIAQNHSRHLSALLDVAQQLNFAIPSEGATHLHFDATRLCTTQRLKQLVLVFSHWQDTFNRLFRPNPRCRRLGPWPAQLLERVCSPDFERLAWSDACRALGQLPLTKYCDYNLINIVTQNKAKPTLEVRNLPATLDSGWILSVASVIESLLMLICSEDAAQTQERLLATPPTVETLLALVEASPAVKAQLHSSLCSDSVQPVAASLNT